MDNLFDDFFDDLSDDFEGDPECMKNRTELYKIIEKHFNNPNNSFENQFVKIELVDGKYDCGEGVNIRYTNKKTNETYKGYVKLDGLMNYMNIEPLFENLKFSNILKEIKKG
jgi:hypothetical protein